MRKNSFIFLAIGIVASCLAGGLFGYYNINSSFSPVDKDLQTRLQPTQTSLSYDELSEVARRITVKILIAENLWGSGIIVHRNGSTYKVLTNEHVLSRSESYQVETYAGNRYEATRYIQANFGANDLGIIEFEGLTVDYDVAKIPKQTPANIKQYMGEQVLASGFPLSNISGMQSNGLLLSFGEISEITDTTFEGGYQIGYTSDIRKGMSGGPLLNFQGEVIAVNGIHAYPLWNAPYINDDGTIPNPDFQERMAEISWGISTLPGSPVLGDPPW